MDYLTRAKYDHGALRMMLDVQKEILARLGKARGVNLLHLEDILRFWEEFFCREHLPVEEEFLFVVLRRLEYPVLTELAAEHEELCFSIEKLVTIAGKLRAGKPNSGREFLEAGNSFSLLLERHLSKENSIFAELTVKEYGSTDFSRSLSPEDLSRLTRLFSLLNDLAGEYLGKKYDTTWLQVEKRKEPVVNREEAAEVAPGNKEETHGRATAEETLEAGFTGTVEGILEAGGEGVTEGSLEVRGEGVVERIAEASYEGTPEVSREGTVEGTSEANREGTAEVSPEVSSDKAAEGFPEAKGTEEIRAGDLEVKKEQ